MKSVLRTSCARCSQAHSQSKYKHMKYLGIDFGIKRVGLAISDPAGKLAFPYKTIYKTTRDKLFSELVAILEGESVDAIVLGLPEGPVAADGTPALIVRQVLNFAQSLKRRSNLPIYLVDEFFTSQEAEQQLRESGLTGKRLQEVLDQQAAALILETFLEGSDPEGSGNFEMV